MNKENVIICRCEDINRAQIHYYLEQGFTSVEHLKRLLRVGMGPCQGSTCMVLLQREIAQFLKVDISEVPTHKVRPLIIGVPIKEIAKDE